MPTTVQVSTQIEAPLEKVFAAFSNLEQAGEIITDIIKMEVLTEGPMKEGTRWRETRVMFGKASTEEMWVTAFDPPNGYTVDAESHGSHYQTVYTFGEKDGGVEVTMTFSAEPLTFFAKLMGFMMAPMMKKTLVKCLEKDMSELKTHLETEENVPTVDGKS